VNTAVVSNLSNGMEYFSHISNFFMSFFNCMYSIVGTIMYIHAPVSNILRLSRKLRPGCGGSQPTVFIESSVFF
jgi:hypothetical protein